MFCCCWPPPSCWRSRSPILGLDFYFFFNKKCLSCCNRTTTLVDGGVMVGLKEASAVERHGWMLTSIFELPETEKPQVYAGLSGKARMETIVNLFILRDTATIIKYLDTHAIVLVFRQRTHSLSVDSTTLVFDTRHISSHWKLDKQCDQQWKQRQW